MLQDGGSNSNAPRALTHAPALLSSLYELLGFTDDDDNEDDAISLASSTSALEADSSHITLKLSSHLKGKGKQREPQHPGEVEYRVLSTEELKEEQRNAVKGVEEMLQLKVRSRFPARSPSRVRTGRSSGARVPL